MRAFEKKRKEKDGKQDMMREKTGRNRTEEYQELRLQPGLYGEGRNRLKGEPDEWERRRYARILRLRRARVSKCLTALAMICSTVCMILICSAAYGALDSNANNSFKYYAKVNVEAGETLWDLAGVYMDEVHYADRKNYIDEVCSINHLKDADSVAEGQTLIVPYYSQEYK